MMRNIFLFLLGMLLLAPTQAEAQTCHSIDSGETTPAGFGVPWNTHTGGQELLITASGCSSNSAVITVGDGEPLVYVYKFGYRWSGSAWVQFALTGSTLLSNNWYVGEATATVAGTGGVLTSVIAYICQRISGAWKCGCKDATCATPSWQLQKFDPATGDVLVAEVVRNTMHANRTRTVPFIPLANATAAAIPTFALVDTITIDGDTAAGGVNEFAGIYPIDVNGDDEWEIFHYNGSVLARVYNQAGTKLWEDADAAGDPHADFTHAYSLAIHDFDGDGGDDIVQCWDDNTNVVMRDGATGTVLLTEPIPQITVDCHIASYYVEGRSTPLILIALTGTVAGCVGGTVTEWSKVRAIDVDFNTVWEINTCDAGHHTHGVDTDGNNFSEFIFIGKYKINPTTGAILCTISIGSDHADGIQIADIIPSNSGFEVAEVGASGGGVYDADNCAQIWDLPMIGPQSVAIGELTTSTGLEVVFQQRPSEPDRDIEIYTATGSLITTLSGFTSGMESSVIQNTNIDAVNQEEIVSYNGTIFDETGIRVNVNSWFGTTTGLVLTTSPVVLDILGNARPEIIIANRNSIRIGAAQ